MKRQKSRDKYEETNMKGEVVGSLKTWVSFAKKPYKRDYILQKRLIILRSLLVVATPYTYVDHTTELHSLGVSKRPKGHLSGSATHSWRIYM